MTNVGGAIGMGLIGLFMVHVGASTPCNHQVDIEGKAMVMGAGVVFGFIAVIMMIG